MEGTGNISDKIIVITSASSDFSALTVRALADRGDTVYAGMRETEGRNAPQLRPSADFAQEHQVDLRSVETQPHKLQ